MRLSQFRRPALIAAAVVIPLAAAGCSGFYSDSPPLNAAPTATRPADAASDPASAIEAAARNAIAERIGVSPGTPRLLGMIGATWTSSNPGCFPFDTSTSGAELVPGVIVTFKYENNIYEYDSDESGTVGALCDAVRRDVPASSANSIFDGQPFLPADPIIFKTQEQATAYIQAHPSAAFNTDLVDWSAESLGATAVQVPDVSSEPLVTGARLTEDGLAIIVELTVSESPSSQPGVVPIWVYLEDIGNAETLQTEISVTQSTGPTATPPPFAQQ